MIPILYGINNQASNYNIVGEQIGRLPDAISCIITEDLEGGYNLEMQYPESGRLAAELMKPGTIAALRPYADGNEFKRELAYFDIHRRTIENGVISVTAGHISYRMAGVVCTRVPYANLLDGVLGMISNNILPSKYVRPWLEFNEDATAVTATAYFASSAVKSVREYYFDSTYSIRTIFGVDAIFHGNKIVFLPHRGEDRGAEIRYGKNLTGGIIVKDETETCSGIYPYWEGIVNGEKMKVLSDEIVSITPVPTPQRAFAVDFSQYFQDKPTRAQLKAVAQQYLDENQLWLAKLNANITFSPEWYQGDTIKEIIDLGDTVKVFYGDADIAGEQLRVVQIKYDCLLEQFSEYTLGELQKQYAVTSRDGISATRQIMA